MEKDLIEYIAKSLVDDPSAVSVNETEGEKGMVLQLRVADGDIGKVAACFFDKANDKIPFSRETLMFSVSISSARRKLRS